MKKARVPGVYQIVNRINGKVYVGESCDVPTRLGEHRSLLRAGDHGVASLQRDFKEMGEAAFDFVLLEVGPSDNRQRKFRETDVIRERGSDDARYGYNQSNGRRWSYEARQRDTERKYIKKWKFELLPDVNLYDPMLPQYVESCMRARENWRQWYEAAKRWPGE